MTTLPDEVKQLLDRPNFAHLATVFEADRVRHARLPFEHTPA